MLICIDNLQYILEFTDDIITKINLCRLSKDCYEYLKIRKLTSQKITQKAIKQKIFNELQILDISGNKNILDINHLSETLEELNCGSLWVNKEGSNYTHQEATQLMMADKGVFTNCSITHDGICNLKKIKKLIAFNNLYIRDISYFKNTLEYLDCSGCSGIKDIVGFKLKILNCHGNHKIYFNGEIDNNILDSPNIKTIIRLEELTCDYMFINDISENFIKHILQLESVNIKSYKMYRTFRNNTIKRLEKYFQISDKDIYKLKENTMNIYGGESETIIIKKGIVCGF